MESRTSPRVNYLFLVCKSNGIRNIARVDGYIHFHFLGSLLSSLPSEDLVPIPRAISGDHEAASIAFRPHEFATGHPAIPLRVIFTSVGMVLKRVFGH